MGNSYGRSLPKGPRPKAPPPKLGEVGARRGQTRTQRRRRKPKSADAPQERDSQGQNLAKAKAKTSGSSKKEKPKQERPRQNTPVRIEIIKPASVPLAKPIGRSIRVVVEWKHAKRRYLAWGKKGIKAVDGWRECSDSTSYHRLLKKLNPIGIKLNIADQQIPVSQILDLIIATGKVLKPRPISNLQGSLAKGAVSFQLPQRRSPRDQKHRRVMRQRRLAISEAARNEVLVVRPKHQKQPRTNRGRAKPIKASNKARRRNELLSQQRKELSRLNWLQRNGYEVRNDEDDMMHVALQGGSPGLKR